MNKLAFLVLFALLKISILHAQQHPGFFFQDSSSTSIINARVRSNGDIVATIGTSNSPVASPTNPMFQNISIVSSDLVKRDSIIWLSIDTSSKYQLVVSHQIIVNDTSYFLGLCFPRGNSTAATNIFTFYLTPQNTFSTAKYLFEQDTIGSLKYWGTTEIDYDNNSGLFELFECRYDSANSSRELFLLRFDKQGNLQKFKTWNYTYPWTQDMLQPWDSKRLANDNYLIVQRNEGDLFFLADPTRSEIDTAYFDDPTRAIYSVLEQKNSYLLFGASDGYDFQSLKDGKAQYVFWEIDKNNYSTVSRKVLRLRDTSTYSISLQFFPEPIKELDNGDYIFTGIENCFRFDNGFTDIFSAIYCVDSLYNVKWSYRVADTTYNDAFGLPKIEKIPNNPDEILWYSRWGDQPLMPTSEVWMRKIKVDGSNLGIEALPLDERKNFALYPNPAKNSCEILLPFLPSQPITIKVININGEITAEHLHQEKSNLIQLSFDLPPGAYSLSLTSSEYQASQQLIIN